MTKTLTEQWREGKLPEGYYYVNNRNWINYYSEDDGYFDDGGIEEVLAPVPKYDEYKQLLKKNERLEKKLAIATKAFEELEVKSDKFYRGDNDWSLVEQLDFIKAKCQETLYNLKEMEGVK